MSSTNTGKRIFAVISIIISVLVLLLAVAGILGTWVARSTAIDVASGVLAGVDQLAQVGPQADALRPGNEPDAQGPENKSHDKDIDKDIEQTGGLPVGGQDGNGKRYGQIAGILKSGQAQKQSSARMRRRDEQASCCKGNR